MDHASKSYSAKHHLADMIAVLEPPPEVLTERDRDMRNWIWFVGSGNANGQLCENDADYFGGPFFADDGKLMWNFGQAQRQPSQDTLGEFTHKDLIARDRKLSDIVPECIREDKQDFLHFIRKMLCWLPEDRATARELIKSHPWLDIKPST